MEEQRHLARGFNWLGGATIIARIVDALTVLAVLLFLTKQQVGIAAIVVSVGMIVEALNGLGTAEALIQGTNLRREALDSLFWFILATSLVVAAATLLAAPLLARAYGVSGIALYLVPIALKQPLVAAAIIPLARLNRALRYERIATVNVTASILAAATRLALAATGAGVWSPVLAYSSSGVWVLASALIASPFLPRRRFEWLAIRPILRFGLRVTASNLTEQVFKNIDFLLVGAFYGTVRLALYRVAFDLAMEPAMAMGTLVNRTALPVFARLSAAHQPLVPALGWSLGRVALLTTPLSAALYLAAGPLTALLHDGQDRSYAAAATPLKLLAAASLLRITTQLLYPIMMGAGRPGLAAKLSALTFTLLTVGILAAGAFVPGPSGITAVAAVWLVVMPLTLLWGLRQLRRLQGIRPATLAPFLRAPVIALAAMVAAVEAVRVLIPLDKVADLIVVVLATALTYAALGARRPGTPPLDPAKGSRP